MYHGYFVLLDGKQYRANTTVVLTSVGIVYQAGNYYLNNYKLIKIKFVMTMPDNVLEDCPLGLMHMHMHMPILT